MAKHVRMVAYLRDHRNENQRARERERAHVKDKAHERAYAIGIMFERKNT